MGQKLHGERIEVEQNPILGRLRADSCSQRPRPVDTAHCHPLVLEAHLLWRNLTMRGSGPCILTSHA